jgi:multimeric flavodoxin WrbA
MKVLGISASPRRQGNTELLLDKALQGAREAGAETEKIVLNEKHYSPCLECGGCDQTGICTVQDEMQEIFRHLDIADAIIVASPIFFGSITAQLKMLIDRHQCYWIKKYVLKRTRAKRQGLFICVGGQNRQDYFQNAEKLVRIFFANIDVIYTGGLFYPGINDKGEINGHDSALQEAFEQGRGLVTE